MPTVPSEQHRAPGYPSLQTYAPVVLINWYFANTATADATIYGPKITRNMYFVRASYAQSADATAVTTYTCQLKNGSTALTTALDIKALGATTSGHADFTTTSTSADQFLQDGDQITAVFDETGGTVTAPATVNILIELQLMR